MNSLRKHFKSVIVTLVFFFFTTVNGFPKEQGSADPDLQSIRFISVVYETLNDENGEWVAGESVNQYQRGLWHYWEQKSDHFRYTIVYHMEKDLSASNEQFYLLINIPGSFEVSIDGDNIGSNGMVVCENGLCREIQPGKNRNIILIPSAYKTQGNHQLFLNGYRNSHGRILHFAGIHIESMAKLMANERWQIINYGSYLVYVVFGVFFLSNFLTRRETLVHLYLGLICFLFSTFALNKLAYYHLDLSYQKAAWVLTFVYSLNYVISVLAHLLVFEVFKFPRKLAWILLPLPLALALLLEGFDSFGVLKVTYEWLALVSVIAIFLRRKHSVTATIILITLSLVYSMRLFDKQQFVIYFALLLYLLFSIALAFYKQNKEKQEALLSNTRLNLELIKNKVQPHFILNSITSAMEWIESDPKQGAIFLNALAREFEVLSRMTDKKLIPVGMEIDSCRNYLRVMEFRKKANYSLKTDGVDMSNTLPPSIIRNLLENAISHNSFGKMAVTFTLTEATVGKSRIYTFHSPFTEKSNVEEKREATDGTGIQYIKARLAESYKGKWTYEHGPLNGQWVTTIKLHQS